MDGFADERDFKLLEKDRYTFFVLNRILGGKCELILSDHERLIVCYSCSPFPIWIWTPDGACKSEMERAYLLAQKHSFLDGKHSFILKYDLARYFIERAAADNIKLSIVKNMCAYNCRKLLKPSVIADGAIHRCGKEDTDELTDFLELFHNETEVDRSESGYRSLAEEHIATGNMYFWKDGQGNNVACCKFMPNGDTASINLVFTRPEFRRKHYAENLVYQVTKIAMDAGYVPMLYTDADYTASNACYQKLGYTLKGKLCTIG